MTQRADWVAYSMLEASEQANPPGVGWVGLRELPLPGGWSGWTPLPPAQEGVKATRPARSPKQEFRTPPGLRKELGGGLLPGCRQDPNHEPRNHCWMGQWSHCGEGKGQNWGAGGSGVLWELPQTQTQQTQEGHTNWGDGITYTQSLAPLTEEEDRNWRPAWAQDRARGTGQLEPTGQLLATLLWKVICKGKVLRGI